MPPAGPPPSRRGLWLVVSLAFVAFAHGAALAGGLLDADRVLIVHNPEIRSFAGLATMLSRGITVVRASGLFVRDRAPLGVLSTWLGWQLFRAIPWMQHALGLACLLAVIAALVSLLEAIDQPPAVAVVAAIAFAVHPALADLTGPILGRPALLALLAVLLAARAAVRAPTRRVAIAWSAVASLAAGLVATGWGFLGLAAAAVVTDPRTRRLATGAAFGCAALTIVVDRSALPDATAAARGAGVVVEAWLPVPQPFVVATAGDLAIVGLAVAVSLVAVVVFCASRASAPREQALFRAGVAAIVASLIASASSTHEGTVIGAPAVMLHLGVVLTLVGVASARPAIMATARPWMLVALLVPLVLTAVRVRSWADEDRVLASIAERDPEDPEALLAGARRLLRRGDLEGAVPLCVRYRSAAPTTARADGCLAAQALEVGQEAVAATLLHRWAARFDDPRALRAAVLELSEASGRAPGDPRFAAVFLEATGLKMPTRRPGELH